MNNASAPGSPHRRWLNRLTLTLALPGALLLSLGCKMAGASSYAGEMQAAPMPDAAMVPVTGSVTGANSDYDYRSDGAYDFEDDVIDAELTATERTVIASRSRGKVAESREYAPPARDKLGEPSTTKKAAESGEPAVAKPDEQPQDHGRQIIYVAGIQVSVYNLEQAMATVEAAPERFGGWIHMRNQSQVVLRLPADQLKPAMAELATLGVVEARTLQAQDVTAEYVDLESRIRVMRETQAQLLDLLGQAKTVEEALHVRTALDQVTMELEVALGRMRQLSDLIAFSTLTVTLVERGPQDNIPTSNDPFGWVDTLGVEATEWR